MVQGKTTLFKVILNLIHIDSGDITLLDKDYKDVDKNKIGCTLANISLCEYLKLKDLIDVLITPIKILMWIPFYKNVNNINFL